LNNLVARLMAANGTKTPIINFIMIRFEGS